MRRRERPGIDVGGIWIIPNRDEIYLWELAYVIEVPEEQLRRLLRADSNINTVDLKSANRLLTDLARAGLTDWKESSFFGWLISGIVILVFQLFVSWFFEKWRAMPAFLTGLLIAAAGFAVIGLARVGNPGLVLLGIFLFAIGEMASSPRIQEYITWLAPKEKAGLYMGSNFLAVAIGGVVWWRRRR